MRTEFMMASIFVWAMSTQAVAQAPLSGPRDARVKESQDVLQMRLGLFIHWAAPGPSSRTGILLPSGSEAQDIDYFADSICVEGVADEIAALRFEYVILTDFHGLGTTLHPSDALERWRGPGYASHRDVVGELIAALRERGIRLILFTHPLDGHDYPEEQRERLGWNDASDGYRRWNDFVNDVYAELVGRYGNDILGIGFDSDFGLSGNAEWKDKLDLPRLRQTIQSRSPGLPLFALAGPNDTCELGMKEVWRPSWLDPWQSRPETDYDVETWPAYRRVVSVVQGYHWATVKPASEGVARLTGEQLFRYTVLQAGVSTEGPGVAWAASPYVDGTWEHGVRESFAKLAKYMAPLEASLRGVYPSASFPTPEGISLATLPHGVVGTRTPDNTVEYIHVLKPPTGKTLSLPPPADGKLFLAASLLRSGRPLTLMQHRSGLELVLGPDDDWDALDTVIQLTVDTHCLPKQNLAWHRPVIASSSIESDGPWPPRSDWGRVRLVDGQRHMSSSLTDWSTGNAGWSSKRLLADHEAWVGVDLGTDRCLDAVHLYPRDDGENTGHGFPSRFEVQVSTDGREWTTVASQDDVPRPTGPQHVSFPAIKGRFIRILGRSLRSNPNDGDLYSMQLVEMEVTGPDTERASGEQWTDR